MKSLFSGDYNLKFINLINFTITSDTNIDNMFYDCGEIIICINEEKAYPILSLSSAFSIDCNNSCFTNKDSKYIKEEIKCIDYCSNDNKYKYEFNNLCYEKCPYGTYTSLINEYICKDHIDNNEEVISRENKTEVIVSSETKTEEIISKEIKTEIIVFNETKTEEFISKEIKTEIIVSSETKTEEIISKEIKTEVIVPSETSKEEYISSKTINVDKISSDNITYNITKSLITLECNYTNLFNNSCKLENIKINIKEDLLNGNLDGFIDQLLNNEREDLIIDNNDIKYEIITINSNNNENKNISIINLGDCEKKIKNSNNISENESLIIFKIDVYEEGLLIPMVDYEIYEPKNKTK
jgi:hypothetical protein